MILLTLPSTLSVITAIINRSIETSVFPQAWKTAIVRPIPKKTHVTTVKDLRPISILPCLSKILERVACEQLAKYVEKHDILPERQSGFRKHRGTATALIDVIDNILTSQDAGEVSLLVLLDFSRAFDTINTQLLLAKLSFYGLEANSLQWFASYLNNRFQFVQLRDSNGGTVDSAPKPVTRGVPQGSILGPLLFIIYTADIISNIRNCKYHMYADDTQIYTSFKSSNISQAVTLINEDLKGIADWADANQLVLNSNKTKYMYLGTRQSIGKISCITPPVCIRDEVLERTTEARNLGVLTDSNLRFENHIVQVVRNCFYKLKILYRVRHFLTAETRLKVCETLILSKWNYADALYGPRLLARTQRLVQRVQNACMRFCYNIPPRSHISPYINRGNMLNMDSRRKLHLASLLFGVLQSQKPRYLFDKLEWATKTNTRSNRVWTLKTAFHATAAFRGSFKYAATKCWNNLPPPLRDINKSKKWFCSKFKILLLCQQKGEEVKKPLL